MANPNLMQQLAAAGLGGGQMVRVPTQAERDEVATVRALQVRTQAAAFASQLLAGERPTLTEWWALAKGIEEYIEGKGLDDAAGAPVQP